MPELRNLLLDQYVEDLHAWLYDAPDPLKPQLLHLLLRKAARGKGEAFTVHGERSAAWFLAHRFQRHFGFSMPQLSLQGWWWSAFRCKDRFPVIIASASAPLTRCRVYYYRVVIMERGAIWLNASGDCGCSVYLGRPGGAHDRCEGTFASFILSDAGGFQLEYYTTELPDDSPLCAIPVASVAFPYRQTTDCWHEAIARRLIDYRSCFMDDKIWHSINAHALAADHTLSFDQYEAG